MTSPASGARHLTAIIARSHGSRWPDADENDALRIDHVLLDEQAGVVAMLTFESVGRERQACELALIAAAREAAGPDAQEDLRYLQSVAAATGVHFARPGAAPAAALHRRRFAMPDRVLLSSVPGAAGAGAFAMLVLPGGPLESAAALAGVALMRPRPRVCGVHLVGALPFGAGAAEMLEATARALDHETRGAVLECHGAGVAQVPMAVRIAYSALAPLRLGALAVVWPSDEVTRDHLRVCGRESDWRRLEGDGQRFERAVTLALDRLSMAEHAGVTRVRIGALAEDDDLRALAAALAGRRVAPGVTLEVIAGGRAAREAAPEAFAALEAAGAQVRDPAEAEALQPLEDGALACGEESGVAEGRTRIAGPWGCAVAACGQAQGDAAPGAMPAARPGSGALGAGEVLEPAAAGAASAIEHGAAHRPPRVPEAFAGPLLGTVVLAAGDDASAARLVPWGPRAQAVRGDALALAQLAFRDLDEKATARALAAGGGFVVAGAHFGGGPHAEAAARVLAALGVRVVLASTYDDGQERLLALHGVLPLRWQRPEDTAALAAGDILEIAGLPEALAPERRLAIRDLTHGRTFQVSHALAPHLLDAVREGGLLGLVARAQAPAGGSAT